MDQTSVLAANICSHHSCNQISQSRASALQSTDLEASCQDPLLVELQDKVRLTLSCLGGHLQIQGDIEPSPVVLGEQTTMKKTTQRFERIATTLADLDAEGINAQSVNDLLTMYVGAASQHVLRTSFVPEQEARNFDRQVMTFWSRPNQHDVTSPLFFLPECGLCSPATCSSPMASLAIGHSYIDGNNPVTRHRHPFQCGTTTRSPTSTTPSHTFTTHEQARFPLKTHLAQPFA